MEKMSTEQLSKSYEEVNKRFEEYVKRVAELRIKDQFLNCPVRRVFISVPMAGRGEGEIAADIEEAKNVFLNFFGVSEEHFEFVSTYIKDKAPEDCMHEPVWYIGNSIKILSTCDIVLFARGAYGARGCGIEDHIADAYRIPSIRIIERYKRDTMDFDYVDGHLTILVPKKEDSKPEYMTKEAYHKFEEAVNDYNHELMTEIKNGGL